MVENSLYMHFLKGDVKFYTAVLLTSRSSLVVCNRYIRSVTLGGHSLERNALANQVVANGVGTVVGQLHVEVVLAGAVRVALHFNDIILVLNEDVGYLVKQRVGLRLDSRFTGFEFNTLHSLLE